MQKKPLAVASASNGKNVLRDFIPDPRPLSLLGRPALVRHRALGRRTHPVAAMIVGTYAVDERYVIVQAFPIGGPPVQFADVQLLDDDPGDTNDAVAWLVT
ncbi:hypothetical protein [Paraburkholderia sp. BR14320]|uniref:hypothetical protein n=1 Tax=unclassified Paraburkholderia TaxID=2615204 RepID=UPI0034CD7FBE